MKPPTRRRLPARPPDAPERWTLDAGAKDLATLVVPPHAHRDRVFEIDCRLVVRAPMAPGAWHALRVCIDGALEWSRHIDTHAPGDSLDHHCRRVVHAGQALRIGVQTEVHGCSRVSLTIEAAEDAR